VSEPTVVVGKVTKAHGLQGEVAVLVFSDNPDRFEPGSVMFFEDGREVRVRASRPNGGRMLVTFDGVANRNAAELLRGLTLVVPRSSLPELPPGEFWPHQLEGCVVVTESGRRVGAITDVVANPAQDLWVTVDEAGTEIMVPAIREVVVDVDVAAGRVLVRDIPGLTVPGDPLPDVTPGTPSG
jgi:16S rRNA processing protein RimM